MTQTLAGAPYWTASAKIPNQYPYLSEDISCEVAIVGGGVTGALCAYQLQQAGIDTVLLDADLFGFGSTGSSSSILQYDFDYELSSLRDLIGLEKAVRTYRACIRGLDEIEKITKDLGANVGFSRRDSFYYTPCEYGTESMKQEYLLRRHHEFPVEFLDSTKAAELFSFRVEAGIYTTGMAGEIDPYRFTQALISEAVMLGMRAYENTSVEVVTPDLDGITLETKTNHTVRAKKMVNATGLSAVKDAGRIAQPKTTFCVVTAPVEDFSGWYNRCIIRDDGDPYIYLRTLPDNRILIGGLDSRYIDENGMLAKFIKAPVSVQCKYNELEQKLFSMMTGIDDITAEYYFSGTSGDTGDGLPYVGSRPGYPNVYYDICTGSNGIVFAQLAADIIRDLYLGGDATDMDLMSFGRLNF
ncbi:MAG TPA: FAD-dependent oxidoreductase [Ruminiclostridium sp.]|nr:FAD-dependent oxidoreductase [Ruminiclostridium sp.]